LGWDIAEENGIVEKKGVVFERERKYAYDAPSMLSTSWANWSA
jgi:hypothetical protein